MVQNSVVDKFLASKKNTLLSYALTLFKVYETDDKLWANDDEFKIIMSGILDIYIRKYYLRSKKELNTLNVNNLNEKEFKLTLSLAVLSDYYKDKYNEIKEKNKKSIYNLTLILYIVTNIDKEISFYNNKGVSVTHITKQIEEYFSDIFKDEHYSKNPFVLQILANKIKDAEKMELRFFESIKDSEVYIRFAQYSDEDYYVDLIHDLKELYNYDSYDTYNVYKKYNFKELFMPVSYSLASITLLKLFSNNVVVPNLLLPITSKYLSNKSAIDEIAEIFSNPYIKDHVSFSTYYSDYKKNYEKYTELEKLDFKMVMFIDESEKILDYSTLKFNFTYYVTEKFLKNNPDFLKFVDKGKGKYHEIKKLDFVNEDELIQLSLKENVNGIV